MSGRSRKMTRMLKKQDVWFDLSCCLFTSLSLAGKTWSQFDTQTVGLHVHIYNICVFVCVWVPLVCVHTPPPQQQPRRSSEERCYAGRCRRLRLRSGLRSYPGEEPFQTDSGTSRAPPAAYGDLELRDKMLFDTSCVIWRLEGLFYLCAFWETYLVKLLTDSYLMHAKTCYVLFATLTQRLDSWRFSGCSPQARGGGAAGCRGVRAGCGGAGLGHGCRGFLILQHKKSLKS